MPTCWSTTPAAGAGAPRGAVVNIASSAGVETSAYGGPPYAAAKAGLVRLVRDDADAGTVVALLDGLTRRVLPGAP